MVEIRTQYSITREALEVFVFRTMRDSVDRPYREVLQDSCGVMSWLLVNPGEVYPPTFLLDQPHIQPLVEDLSRDGLRPRQEDQQGRVEALTAHKNDLKALLERVLPSAIRGPEMIRVEET